MEIARIKFSKIEKSKLSYIHDFFEALETGFSFLHILKDRKGQLEIVISITQETFNKIVEVMQKENS